MEAQPTGLFRLFLRESLALAQKQWSSFRSYLAEPSFQDAIFSADTTTQPAILDIAALMDQFSSEYKSFETAHTPGAALEKEAG